MRHTSGICSCPKQGEEMTGKDPLDRPDFRLTVALSEMTIFLSCQTRALALLADRPEGRPLQDRSIGSVGGSTENCTVATEICSCTRLEQRRRRERVRNSAESSQPTALRRRQRAASSVVPLPANGSRTT